MLLFTDKRNVYLVDLYQGVQDSNYLVQNNISFANYISSFGLEYKDLLFFKRECCMIAPPS